MRLSLWTVVVWAFASSVHAATARLAWDANAEPDVAGYVVQYGDRSGVYGHNLDVGFVTTCAIDGLEPDTTYYFVVRAYNTRGLLGPPSVEMTYWLGNSGTPPPPAPTPAPAPTPPPDPAPVPLPDPAPPTSTSPSDADGDGLPDAWEVDWGLDPWSSEGQNGGAGDPDGDDVVNIEEYRHGTHPRGFVTRYFAEGALNDFFETRFALANPHIEPARVLLEFQALNGRISTEAMTLPGRSRTTLPGDALPMLQGESFATRLESDRLIAAERLMEWDKTRYGSHAEAAIQEPSTVWYFAEGATHGGFDLFYLLQNPSAQAATIDIRYLRAGGAPPIVTTHELPPRTRANVRVDDEDPELIAVDVATEIRSRNGVPIIAERAMYFTAEFVYEAGHCAAGVTAPSRQWFLAEGATGMYFSTFVLIANPTSQDAVVTATYLLRGQLPITRTYRAPANSRVTVDVGADRALSHASFALRLTSTEPVVVERSVWWPGLTSVWTEGHNSFAAATTGTKWVVAEGEDGGPLGRSTYILIANTSPYNGEVVVTLLFEDASEVSRTIRLPASSRVNVPFDGAFAVAKGKRFATIVESTGDTPAQIVVEHSMYASPDGRTWTSGSNAPGTRVP